MTPPPQVSNGTVRRVLIVSPNFPPLNAPDLHRVRMALPHFPEFGWEPTILCLHPREGEGVVDRGLVRTIPPKTRVVQSAAIPRRWTQRIGVRATGLRAAGPMAWSGGQLLRREAFDLVFFSTTVFPVPAAGPIWKWLLGVPYVIDIQDPWLTDYYHQPGAPAPPGGWLKYRFGARLAGSILEPPSMRNAAHIVCVSPSYPKLYRKRYGIRAGRFSVIPFGASEADFRAAAREQTPNELFDRSDGLLHWVSVGAAGELAAPLLRDLFEAFARLRNSGCQQAARVRFHFAGTTYAPGRACQAPSVLPVARDAGLADVVTEHPGRVAYLSGLRALLDSDLVLAVGTTDPSYIPSKLYPSLMSRRPLLAHYHSRAGVHATLDDCRPGSSVPWSPGDSQANVDALVQSMARILSGDWPSGQHTRWDRVEPHTARSMTRTLCRVFDRAAVGG